MISKKTIFCTIFWVDFFSWYRVTMRSWLRLGSLCNFLAPLSAWDCYLVIYWWIFISKSPYIDNRAKPLHDKAPEQIEFLNVVWFQFLSQVSVPWHGEGGKSFCLFLQQIKTLATNLDHWETLYFCSLSITTLIYHKASCEVLVPRGTQI